MTIQDKIVTELLPCPFCGGDPEMHFDGGSAAWVSCPNSECFVQPEGSTCHEKSHAARVWNTRSTAQERALDDDAREALERIKRICGRSDMKPPAKVACIESIAHERLQAKAPETGEGL